MLHSHFHFKKYKNHTGSNPSLYATWMPHGCSYKTNHHTSPESQSIPVATNLALFVCIGNWTACTGAGNMATFDQLTALPPFHEGYCSIYMD